MPEKYFERGVFLDEHPFVTIRLWRGGVMVRNFGMLKPRGVRSHDGSISIEHEQNPNNAQEAADHWRSITEVVEVNP